MSQVHTYRSALKEALAITGGERQLSIRLHVSTGLLKSWLEGTEAIPDDAFLEAVDVIARARFAGPERSGSN